MTWKQPKPTLQSLIEQAQAQAEPAPESADPVDLGDMSARKAVALVKGTTSRTLLESWLESETRKSVVAALETALE